jgi:peptide chain release factor 3
MAEDTDGASVFLARNSWELSYAKKERPDIRFDATRERG